MTFMLCAVCGLTSHETNDCPTVQRWMEGDDSIELRAKPITDGKNIDFSSLIETDDVDCVGGYDFSGDMEDVAEVQKKVDALVKELGGTAMDGGLIISADYFAEFSRRMDAIHAEFVARQKARRGDDPAIDKTLN